MMAQVVDVATVWGIRQALMRSQMLHTKTVTMPSSVGTELLAEKPSEPMTHPCTM